MWRYLAEVLRARSPGCVRSKLKNGLVFLMLALIFQGLLLGMEKFTQRSSVGPISTVHAVVTAFKGTLRGYSDMHIYEVKFPGLRGYRAIREIYVWKNSCGFGKLEKGHEVVLELQDFNHVKRGVRMAMTMDGCILYDEAIRNKMDDRAENMKYLMPVGMLIFAFICIFDALICWVKSIRR
jgi:hypothetical protein